VGVAYYYDQNKMDSEVVFNNTNVDANTNSISNINLNTNTKVLSDEARSQIQTYTGQSCETDDDCGIFLCYNNECLVKECTCSCGCHGSECGADDSVAPGYCISSTASETTEMDTSDWLTYENENQSDRKLVIFSPGKLNEPYVLYIVSTTDGSIIHRIETGLDNYEVNGFILGGDKIFFYSWDDKIIKTINYLGNITSLDFTDSVDYEVSRDFIINSDGSKIVRVEHVGEVYASSELYLYDINKKTRELVYKEEFDPTTYTYISPISWGNSEKKIYFSKARGEIGGYIVFGGFRNLNSVDLTSKDVEENLIPLTTGWSYGTDIYNNQLTLHFTQNREDGSFMYLTDLDTDENVVKQEISNNEGFTGGGAGKISPDLSKIVFNIAHWDPEDEHYRTMLYDITTKKLTILGDYPDDYYKINNWINNDMFVQSQRGEVQIVDIEGTVVKRIVE